MWVLYHVDALQRELMHLINSHVTFGWGIPLSFSVNSVCVVVISYSSCEVLFAFPKSWSLVASGLGWGNISLSKFCVVLQLIRLHCVSRWFLRRLVPCHSLVESLAVLQSIRVILDTLCLELVPEPAWNLECGLGMRPPARVSTYSLMYVIIELLALDLLCLNLRFTQSITCILYTECHV